MKVMKVILFTTLFVCALAAIYADYQIRHPEKMMGTMQVVYDSTDIIDDGEME